MPEILLRSFDTRLHAPDSGNGDNFSAPLPHRRAQLISDEEHQGGSSMGFEREKEATPVAIAEERFNKGREVNVAELTERCCIDGRKAGKETVNVPGGDAGILAVEIGTVEGMTGIEVTQEMTDQIVDAFIEAHGGVYLHSDMHAAEKIAKALQAPERGFAAEFTERLNGHAGAEWVVELIHNPQAVLQEFGDSVDVVAVQDALLELMVEYLGCGHLAQMNSRGAEYDERKGVVGNIVRSIVRAQWAGKNAQVDFLPGDHGELLVAAYTKEDGLAEDSTIRVVIPNADGKPIFPLHNQVAQLFYAQDFATLMKIAGAPESITADEFVAKADALAGKQAGLTMPALARTLQANGTLPDGVIPLIAVTESADGQITVQPAGEFKA